MLTRFRLWIAGAVALVLAVLGAWIAGRREARQEARTEALRGDVEAYKTRERIEDAIDQDVDLVARAKRAGVLRPGGE